ncbi:MAG: rod shape-determining protein MreC [Verrucomicrobiota bacterium]|jgi:rod shape-determining protein MreC|nr:rod shape-determining protein MreC [Verrucomicrobiota bacterium]MDK2962847.1 rod shape-determining protein MreC [Verrucomicrobiota bacterium]
MIGRKRFVRWIAAAVALLLLFSLPGGCTARIRGVFKDVITPLNTLVLKTGRSLKEGIDTVRGFGGLAEENSRLTEEVVHLQARNRVLENLAEENIRLQQQLDFRNRQSRDLIACQVVARTISGWWQSVRVSKGASSGIGPNRAVISSDGLVGRTAEVSAHTADVLLVSDPACKVSARISRTGAFGVVSGRGTNLKGYPVARMQFIHKDIPVRAGDAVVTSGLGGVFPKDVLIGYVDDVHTEETGLYQYADIIPNAVIDLLDVVFISTGNDDSGDAE